MKLTKASLKNPAAVIVIGAMVLLLGMLSIFRIPAQLLPNIEKPIISVINAWPGASPNEIESEISVPVEEVLLGTPGMTDLVSWNMPNFGFMQLEFSIETDMTRALIEVISRLNRLRPLPSNAEKPQILMGEWGDANNTLIEYFIQQTNGDEVQQAENSKFLRDQIIPELQSLPGVARIEFDDGSGGAGEQLQIIFDPYKAAELGIDIAKVTQQIGRSADISSGFVDVGRKQFIVRYEGRYDYLQLSELILEWRNGLPIKLGDLAEFQIGHGRLDGFIYQNGNKAFRVSVNKSNDANVLEALDIVKAKMAELNDGIFAERGLHAQYAFDPSRYIKRSIGLLGSNLVIGTLLAIFVLWLFLRQWRATLLIALAIPVSLLATFIVLSITGRSLNVISLAGLAFATGMVLDAAIVVLENIVRLRERGDDLDEACDSGATQVWGALLASTATTVAIFIPIMFLEDAEGQMFADLALTIAIGVSMSLLVAVTILPTGARYWMSAISTRKTELGHLPVAPIWERMAAKLMSATDTTGKRFAWIASLIIIPITLMILYWPTSNYLPPVKRDTIDSFLFFPPGVNVATADKEIAKVIDARLQPYMQPDSDLKISDYFFWSFPGASGGWLAINGEESTDLQQLQMKVQTEIISGIPDLFGFSMRRSLFGGFSDSNSVEMELTSTDLNAVKQAAMAGMGMVMQQIPGATANPIPDPFADSTELRFSPKDVRLAEVGWTRQDLAIAILQLGQGAWIGEYFDGKEKLDIFVKMKRFATPEEMSAIPISTPLAGVIPIGELANIAQVPAPSAIVRFERKRGYSLTVNPPEGMSLEQLINELKTKVEPGLIAMLPPDGDVKYAGSAEDLTRAMKTLGANFLMAFSLLLLILAALFRSLKLATLIVISIPLAGFGGVMLLNIMDKIQSQPLDLLGMIGFIILLGLVVNNAILLVAQTQKAMSRGATVTEAVNQALSLRLRPIFMSTLTSLFGMLPLLLFPGAGSEIYRGMAAAIVGGMSVSTIFTLVLLPSLLQVALKDGEFSPKKPDKHKHRSVNNASPIER